MENTNNLIFNTSKYNSKLVIFEGMDNTGKTTTIKRFCKFLNENNISYKVIKADNPKPNQNNIITNVIDTISNIDDITKNYYNNFLSEITKAITSKEYNFIILDRSWISEYVYGQIYRDRIPMDITDDIMLYEHKIAKLIDVNNIYLFTLITDNIKFLIKNEDGNSLSKCNNKLLLKEKYLFDKIFNYSLIKNKYSMNISEISYNENYVFYDILPDVIKIIFKYN